MVGVGKPANFISFQPSTLTTNKNLEITIVEEQLSNPLTFQLFEIYAKKLSKNRLEKSDKE